MIYSTMIYRWVNSGQRTFLRFLTILSSGQFFGLHEVTHDGNEPTVPANEDLVGTNSFQDMWGGACFGIRRQKKKASLKLLCSENMHYPNTPQQNVIKNKMKATIYLLTCMNS